MRRIDLVWRSILALIEAFCTAMAAGLADPAGSATLARCHDWLVRATLTQLSTGLEVSPFVGVRLMRGRCQAAVLTCWRSC